MKKTVAALSLTLAGGLALAGCSAGTPTPAPVDTAPAANAPAATPPAPAATAEPTTSASGPGTPAAGTPADAAAHNDAGHAALATAERAAMGKAIALDHDDNRWEVDVLVGDRVHEFTLDAAGTAVTERSEEGADADDVRRAGVAPVALGDALRTALEHTPGVVDDVELDERGGTVVWEVTIDTADRDDVDVDIDADTGEVVA